MAGLTHPSLVILSGAGLSAESGVATFRGADGLWEGHRIEEVATPEAFKKQPELVQRFYNLRRAALKTVEPNAAHHALVRLEREWPGSFLHITQNVDDLNERAGAQKLLYMHGQLRQVRCTWCRAVLTWEGDLETSSDCPECARTGKLRPDIVWFGEMPYYIDEIMRALEKVDIFLCIGTSGVVYPAAGFARLAAEHGCARLIEMNLERTGISDRFTEQRHGPATVVVPALVGELLSAL
jgi:NAD-dependent deacetylase